MDIYQTLHKDHETVKGLLTKLVNLPDDESSETRAALVTKIRDELVPHSRAEEAIFYNSLRLIDDSKKVAMHGFTEHMEAEGLLRTLQATSAVGAGWRPVAEKLKQSLEHHIKEEEVEMFAIGKQLFTSEEAKAMAEAFEQMKPEIKEGGFLNSSKEMIANLMPPKFSDQFRRFEMGGPESAQSQNK